MTRPRVALRVPVGRPLPTSRRSSPVARMPRPARQRPAGARLLPTRPPRRSMRRCAASSMRPSSARSRFSRRGGTYWNGRPGCFWIRKRSARKNCERWSVVLAPAPSRPPKDRACRRGRPKPRLRSALACPFWMAPGSIPLRQRPRRHTPWRPASGLLDKPLKDQSAAAIAIHRTRYLFA